MTLFQAILLSIIEGITEFLPVSSTGHLILAAKLLGLAQTEFVKTFEIVIQLGAILAVVCLYGQRLVTSKKILARVVCAFLPTALAGYTLYPFVRGVLFDNPMVSISALLVGGVALILFEYMFKQRGREGKIEDLSLFHVLLIGVVQSVSFIPGVSRAAATIFGGLAVGLSRTQAVEFSFLLAIPTMFAASGLDFIKSGARLSSSEFFLLGIGLIGSFITAFAVIRWFIGFIKRHTFIPFGIYRILTALFYYALVIR